MADPALLMANWPLVQQRLQQQQMELNRMQALQAARGPAMQQLYGAMGQPQPVPAPPPPQAQPPAPPPGAMSPGGGNPMAQGGASVMAPPPQPQAPPMQATGMPGVTPQPIPPFRPLPSPQPQMQGGAPQVPQPPAQPPPEQAKPPSHIDIRQIIQQMQKAGVPPEKAADQLEALMPVIQAAQQDELRFFQAQTKAQSAAIQAFRAEMGAYQRGQEIEIKRLDEKSKEETRSANVTIKREKEARLKANAAASAGGTANLKTTELIYPKGADGKPDESQAPIGVRGITKTGKIITLDAEGKPATLQGGTAKEAKDAGRGSGAAVRQNIVKAGITNSLARLNEIEKAHPGGTTSMFFGQSAQNPVTRGLYGAGKSAQTKAQQDVDAKWASMIDEAIPVFTGGLRGSDAFRRFLIEQAPGPGDKPETVKEKMRLFRQNIEGTSKAFFNKFSNDPSFWGPGVTKEEVQGGGGGSEPKKISGDAEYDALPTGTEFIAPDGSRRRKP